MKFSVFQTSRRGGREINEDRMGYCYTRESALFVLADGMGGHPMGEVAAQIAIQSVSKQFQVHAKPQLSNVATFLPEALLHAHHQILRYAHLKGLPDTPRTTLVAAVVQDGRACWVHCGDSRLYLVRAGQLLARTRDHSYLELQKAAIASASKVNRNVLFTCLGSPTKPIYDVSAPIALERGDRLMLCSDGLWGVLDDDAIVRQLAQHDVASAVPELVEQALMTAGDASDNVTAIALEWESPSPAQASPGISTDSIGDDMFASTIQAEPLDGAVDDLDDEAIERSIAEINEAIRRSAARRRSS